MPDSAVPIYTDYDFWVPAFELKVKGQNLDSEAIRDVLSVSYTDSLDKLDSCEITLNNWDADKRAFKYSDPAATPVSFDPGAEIELSMGYLDRGGLTPMLRGRVVSLAPDFPAGGQPTIQVRALNQLYKLHFKQETQVFQNKTDSQIVRAVLDRINQDQAQRRSAGGKPAPTLELASHPAHASEAPHEYMVISNEYPIVFLLQRARHNGYEMYIEEAGDANRPVSRLHFEPPARQNPAVYELVWGKSLVSFKPTLKTKNQVAKVTVRGWNPVRTREPIVGEATWDDLDIQGLPSTDDMQAVDSALAGSEEVVADEPIHDENEAREKARGILLDKAKDLVTGSGTTVGLPGLRAGRPVFIKNLGSRFSGRYLVTSTTHSLSDSGYTTTFEARLEELR